MPIKEKILEVLARGPMKYKKLVQKFKASKKFFNAINELYNEGRIEERNGEIFIVEKKKKNKHFAGEGEYSGTVVKLTENFGFIRPDGETADIFVSGRSMMGAVPGDKVLFNKVYSSRRDTEAEIVAITEEKTNLVAVITSKSGKMYAVLRDAPSVVLKVENRIRAKEDDIVIVDILGRGTTHRHLTCEVTRLIGEVSSSEKAVRVLLAENSIEEGFSDKVLTDAHRALQAVDFEKEASKREDFTATDIFTIDSASTKDIDDAIHLSRTENGYELGVHIADVSFYIRGGTDTDSEAYHRGNSIYYGNSVVPMLPKLFSNDVCSLNEKQRRLAFSCIMQLDRKGNIISYRFAKSVIKSRVKGVYSEINEILSGMRDEQIKNKYADVKEEITIAKELYDILRIARQKRGYMNIESDEAYILFDEKNRAVGVKRRERGESEQIIEEFMILANCCAADFGRKNELPFLYRVHEQPSIEKLEILKENLLKMNLSLSPENGQSLQQTLSVLLDETRATPLKTTVHRMVLRSMSKAKYSDQRLGHFSLALGDYSHFTSPIRRYSDLAIHRIMSDFLSGRNIEYIKKRYTKFAPSRSNQASEREVIAMTIERDADEIYKAEIMSDHIGESFTGIITSVTSFGIYVTLENTIEGLVHVSELGMINPELSEGYSLSCRYTGRNYTIGDTLSVKIAGVDILNGNVDFLLDDVNPVHEKIRISMKKKSHDKEKSESKSQSGKEKMKYKRK